MPRGRKPKQVSESNAFTIALEDFKKGFNQLIEAAYKLQQPSQPAQKGKSGKQDSPTQGEPAYALYQILEKSKRPVKVEALAKKLGKSTQSIRLYLSKYNCFENVRGKGYKLR